MPFKISLRISQIQHFFPRFGIFWKKFEIFIESLQYILSIFWELPHFFRFNNRFWLINLDKYYKKPYSPLEAVILNYLVSESGNKNNKCKKKKNVNLNISIFFFTFQRCLWYCNPTKCGHQKTESTLPKCHTCQKGLQRVQADEIS